MNLHLYLIGKIFEVIATNWEDLAYKKVAVVVVAGLGNYDEEGTVEEMTEDIEYCLYSFENYHSKTEEQLKDILATLQHYAELKELRKELN